MYTHDTLISIDGSKVWMENKSNSDKRMRMATTADSDSAIKVISQQAPGKIAPFTVTSHGDFMPFCDYGYYGFRYMNGNTGVIEGSVPFSGTKPTSDLKMHGIGITPNETEVWACDKGVGNRYVHVFQMKRLPPTQTHLVTVSNGSPHWLTFDLAGKYCYVAGAKGANRNTDIVSTASYSKIGQISPSEDMLEVDFVGGAVSAVGNQFGVGRLP
jgi:DNA-binding beta-propeller fold protein YncE